MPHPDHVSARPEDVPNLIQGLIECERGPSRTIAPVIAAAVITFGFYIHPSEDGNGRIHRYLIHHVLARHGFTPPCSPSRPRSRSGSTRNRTTLESYAARLLPIIEWRPTPAYEVDVLNDTGDFYRFFDATPHAEFLMPALGRPSTRTSPPRRLSCATTTRSEGTSNSSSICRSEP